jgi:TonB family protein
MKLRDLYHINSRRGLLLSILFHSCLLALATTAALLTTPQGIVVSEELEFGDPSSGLPIPVDIQNTLPKGEPEKVEIKKPIPKEDVVEVPKPKVPEKIETQRVDVKPKQVAKTKNKAWVPVEETDVDDGPKEKSKKDVSSDDAEETAQKETKAATEEGGAGVADAEEKEITTDESGEDTGPVHSEKELKVVSGAPYKWPFLQRVQRNEGTTVIRFTVSEDGTVEKVWVHETSGFEALDRAAVEGHYKAKYETGIEGTFQKRVIWRLTGPAVQMPFRNN